MDSEPIKNRDNDFCADVESKDKIHPSSPPLSPNNGGASLGPITPFPNKECAVFTSNFTSPLASVSSPPPTIDFDDNPHTPRESAFDPFAPGPDNLMLAPNCIKNLENLRSHVAKRLNFRSGCAEESCAGETEFSENDRLFETVYDTVLEAIVSEQAEVVMAEMMGFDSSSDGFMTPPCVTRLAGVAEACPDAPLKPAGKSRKIVVGLCRKLEFDF